MRNPVTIVGFGMASLFGLFVLLGSEPAFGFEKGHYRAEGALGQLQKGNEGFVSSKKNAELRAGLTEGQFPFAVIVGCSDSRVSPELVFDQNIGDLFVVRTAGNLVDGLGLGSIEYAVEHLGVRLVLVMGHENCGAVKAAMKSSNVSGNLKFVVDGVKAATGALPKGANTADAVAANARGVAEKIRKSKPSLSSLAGGEEVIVKAAVYDLVSGKVRILD